MKFHNFKIGTRLGIGFAAILALMALMLVSALWQFQRISEAKSVMVETHQDANRAQVWLEGIAANSVRNLAKVKSITSADEAYYDAEMKPIRDKISRLQKELDSSITSDTGRELLRLVDEQRKRYTGIRDQALAQKSEYGADSDELRAFIEHRLTPAMHDYVGSVEKVVAYQEQLFEMEDARIDAMYAGSKRLLSAIGILAIACAALFGFLLSRSITRPLSNAIAIAGQVASGDLTKRIQVTSRDEVGDLLDALRTMSASLHSTVTQVRVGTETTAAASHEIASGNLDLSARTEQQAAALEQTASAMEELTGSVRQNADSAYRASTLAQSASGVAARGGIVVTEVVATMASIKNASKRIGDIIGIIDGISFQTNILALNAAVEAARAGEHGRGFAVVASEVRHLARRSADAAKEIRDLIADSVARVDAGSRLADEAGITMQSIESSIGQVTSIIGEIAAASAEQSAGIEQINTAIISMDGNTQQNAALVEEAAAAASSLVTQASALAQLVTQFKIEEPANLLETTKPLLTQAGVVRE